MNEETQTPITESIPENHIDVAKTLEKPFDLFTELNTVITFKDDFKPEQLEKKTSEVINALLSATGIELPAIKKAAELESQVSEKDKSLSELNSKIDELTIKEADYLAKLTKLESDLKEFKGLQAGKNKREPTQIIDPMEKYESLMSDNRIIEASRYARDNGLFSKKSK